MATVISLIQDLRRPKTDGTCPVCLFLSWQKKRSYIRIEDAPWVKPKYWSQETGRITKGAVINPSPGFANDKITARLSAAQTIIDQAASEGRLEHLTHDQLKDLITKGRPKGVSFSGYLDNLITEFENSGNFGQRRVYHQVRQFLKKYGDLGPVYQFSDVNYRLIKLMENRHSPRIEGNLNGLAVTFRTIRAVWNRAIKEGVTSSDAYPFSKYSIKKSKTHKRAIKLDEFERLGTLNLPIGTLGWHTLNMFFFSFYCRGMNFADIAALKYSNISGGRIIYVRKKTGKQQTIKIDEPIKAVLDLYKKKADMADYVFPVVSQPGKGEGYQALKYLSSANHALKRYSVQLQLDHSLSFNTARHSWATIGRDNNLPIGVISQGLGHSDIETTQIYLDDFDTSVMDDASCTVNNLIKFPIKNKKP